MRELARAVIEGKPRSHVEATRVLAEFVLSLPAIDPNADDGLIDLNEVVVDS